MAERARRIVEDTADDAIFDLVGFLDTWLEAARERGTDEDRADAYFFRAVALAERVRDPIALAERERLLINNGDIPTEAGYWLSRVGRHRDAVVALEHARAVLFGRLTGWLDPAVRDLLLARGHTALLRAYVSALSGLADRHREQYATSARVPGRLVVGGAAFATGFTSDLAAAHAGAERAARAVEAALGQPYKPFLPIPYEAVQRAAARLPLVYLGAAEGGGYALVVRAGSEPEQVPLPLLNAGALAPHVEAFRALGAVDQQARRAPIHAAVEHVASALTRLAEALTARRGAPPAVGVVAMGALGQLPVHGALQLAASRLGAGPLTLHLLPNAGLLTDDRPPPPPTGAVALLVAPQDRHRRMPALRRTGAEASWLGDRYGRRLRVWAPARTADVGPPIARADVVQFLCHGRSRPDAPLDSALLLSDGDLTVRDLLVCRGAAHRLVVLGACESQVFDARLADETIGLPLALLQAGSRTVVANQWIVLEQPMTVILRALHDGMAGGLPPAAALARAQAWLRDATADELHRAYPTAYRLLPGADDADKRRRPFTHPADWAAFTASGR